MDREGLDSRRDCLLCPATHVIYTGPTLQTWATWICKEEVTSGYSLSNGSGHLEHTHTEGMEAGAAGKEERIKGTRQGEGERKEERDKLVNRARGGPEIVC